MAYQYNYILFANLTAKISLSRFRFEQNTSAPFVFVSVVLSALSGSIRVTRSLNEHIHTLNSRTHTYIQGSGIHTNAYTKDFLLYLTQPNSWSPNEVKQSKITV